MDTFIGTASKPFPLLSRDLAAAWLAQAGQPICPKLRLGRVEELSRIVHLDGGVTLGLRSRRRYLPDRGRGRGQGPIERLLPEPPDLCARPAWAGSSRLSQDGRDPEAPKAQHRRPRSMVDPLWLARGPFLPQAIAAIGQATAIWGSLLAVSKITAGSARGAPPGISQCTFGNSPQGL
ncbi:hypothetical protein GQ53DRAFT_292971 [Thozetella sp. PMI_491]|nr:hypothetical protein GQ53DRAFT_292971 [Thozetella sp. PMI_491]